MSTRRVLITGGGGNLSKYVIEELKKEYEIKVLDLREPRDSQHQFIQVDITSFKEVEEALKDIDAIIHLAAIPYDTGEAQKIWRTNATGTFNILASPYIIWSFSPLLPGMQTMLTSKLFSLL